MIPRDATIAVGAIALALGIALFGVDASRDAKRMADARLEAWAAGYDEGRSKASAGGVQSYLQNRVSGRLAEWENRYGADGTLVKQQALPDTWAFTYTGEDGSSRVVLAVGDNWIRAQ